MAENMIKIRGARVHNLKSVDVDIPMKKISCFTGPSGSGKSSLAFHTLYAESKRRYLNSFPNYLKFFSDRPPAVDVDEISPVLPCFALHQINPIIGARSMVMDVMGLTSAFQNIFYRYGERICPFHKEKLIESTLESQLELLIKKTEGKRFYLFVERESYLKLYPSSEFPSYSFGEKERRYFSQEDFFWEIGRFSQKSSKGVLEQIHLFLEREIKDFYLLVDKASELNEVTFSHSYQCPQCDISFSKAKKLSYFSSYNALGACSKCDGYGANLEYDFHKIVDENLSLKEKGILLFRHKRLHRRQTQILEMAREMGFSTTEPIKKLSQDFFELLENGKGKFPGLKKIRKDLEKHRYKPFIRILIRSIQKEVVCSSCEGTRIGDQSQYFGVKLKDNSFYQLRELLKLDLKNLATYFEKGEVGELISLACSLGLGHLSLSRKSRTLSSGEYQRLLMLKYLSFKGTSSLFVFDEPSLGLSECEQSWLFKGFQKLKEQGNTVVIVDHSTYLASRSDQVFRMGPGAGERGGELLKGRAKEKRNLVKLPKIKKIKNLGEKYFGVEKPSVYGRDFSSIHLPYGKLSLVRGPSGSGKTASIIHCLANQIQKNINEEFLTKVPSSCEKLILPEVFKGIVIVDANLNRYTSRSTVGSMTGFAGVVRKHFSQTAQAKSMGLQMGHFSSNSALGQCPTCEGKGFLTVEMQFLEDVTMVCEDCSGHKIEPRYAEVSDGKMEVWEAFKSPLSEVISNFRLTPKFKNLWSYMKLLNLDYLSLDRTVMSLSGGERQRLYLLSQMAKKLENQLIIFENLSFGLSEREMEGIGLLLLDLVKLKNTLILIDQNPFFENFSHYTVSF